MKYRNLNIAIIILTLIVSVNNISFSKDILSQTKAIANNYIDKYKILCGSSNPLPIIGTSPTGVGPIVKFKWIKSLDTLTNIWSVISPNDTLSQYQPPNPGSFQNFYKRIVISDGFSDTSNVCVVKVIPGSTNFSANTINPPIQNIHIGVIPSPFNGTQVTGGTLIDPIKYIWLKSQDPNFTTTYPATEGTYQNQNLTFTEGADTTYYYNRFAYILLPTSELACISYSNLVKVLLIDTNVIMSPDTIICSGMGTVLIGNTEINYTYQWQFLDGTTWINIFGATNANYHPINITALTKYRRIVTSNGLPVIISNVITVHVNPAITNNSIWNSTQNICSGLSGAVLLGLSPNGGNNIYQYAWYYSNNQTNWTLNTGPSTINYYSSTAVYNTMYFVRVIQSGVCIDTSIVVAVTPIVVTAVATSPILICGNQGTLDATPVTTGNGWWTAPPGVTFTTPDSLYNSEISIPAFTTNSYSYSLYWHVQDFSCKDSVAVSVIFYHTINTPNAGIDIYLTNENSVAMDATPPPFGTGYWSVFIGGASFVYTNDAHTVASSILSGENIFRWTVTNGPCLPQHDDVKITVTNSNIPEGFSPNGDGVNDYFEVAGIDNYPGSEFIVFNRWGIEVYRKKVYDNKWDGKTLNGIVLPEDTYFYLLKFDENETQKGYIVLKR